MAEIAIFEKYDCDSCQADKRISMDCLGVKEKGNRICLAKGVPRLTVRRCPRALVEENPDSLDYWDDYLTWNCLKALPKIGGTDDQDCRVIEAIRYISGLISRVECDDDFIKWQQRKTKEKFDKEELADKRITSFSDISKNRKSNNVR